MFIVCLFDKSLPHPSVAFSARRDLAIGVRCAPPSGPTIGQVAGNVDEQKVGHFPSSRLFS